MKIVHISVYPDRGELHAGQGGVASYTKNLVTLNQPPPLTDHEVIVLCNKIDGAYEYYHENNVTIIRYFDRNPRFIFQILQMVRTIKPDVIHIQQELHLFGGILTGYLLQWLMFFLRKYRLIITLHGVVSLKLINKDFIKENNAALPVPLVKLAFWLIYKPLTYWADRVIVHAEYFKNILIHEYGVPPDKIAVIPHGVENLQPIPKDEACRTLTLDPRRDIVLFMGYLTGYKGIGLLLEGFAEYAKANANAYLVVGAGMHPKLARDEAYLKEYKRLQDKARALISADQCRWVGYIPEDAITAYYSAADVSVYPYTICMSSSGPMAIAIAHEKPFLATDVFQECFSPAQRLALFPRDPRALARKLGEYFANPDPFLSIARELKPAQSWNTAARQTFELYQSI